VFVAGTDTGIGKTHASVALIHALRADGRRVCGMKPVASGCVDTPQGRRNDDALALQAASHPRPDYAAVNPVALAAPVSPHLAAAAEGIEIALPPLRTAYDALAARCDAVVVEGVGGWLAPLDEGLPASALAQAFELPVVLVVGLRLGCLNHALLSARAIIGDGCRLLGWIGNRIDPDMAMVDANIATLGRLLPVPCLGVLAFGEPPEAAAGRLQATVRALD
jgi:dethiobiotin synthetase